MVLLPPVSLLLPLISSHTDVAEHWVPHPWIGVIAISRICTASERRRAKMGDGDNDRRPACRWGPARLLELTLAACGVHAEVAPACNGRASLAG